ncbi:DNA polymerase III subunit alpha [Candidatus Dojkabacteria bacterium]|jgi:DNA polymerase-3 subunit alpha|nr:DNA polymerase III subunit alpha [Candidatus Dojkabacteria bacterium]
MFTHLHVHTEYSLLDGVNRIPTLVAKIKELGMTSCAITDHGSMYGVFKFFTEMKKAELKPILGCEIYIAPRSRFDKEHGIDNHMYHMTLLAKNLVGYKNLMKLVSAGHMEGYYYRPRVDIETLQKYSEGIIALSGCLQGPIVNELMKGNEKRAVENLKIYSEVFKENFFIEIQRNSIEEQENINPKLIELAKKYKLKLVATCDSHYLNKEDSEVQEVLWCISDGKTLSDPTRRVLPSNEFYVKSNDEMEKLFKDLPEAIKNTQLVSDMVENYEISFGRIEPKFNELPKGKDAKTYLRELTYDGAKKHYEKITKSLKERIDYELSVIDDKGYNDYFLIMQMIVNYCRENGIVVSMRGSGTGSVVAYSVGITSIDPIGWGLYFERFLNPERKSAPDFDLDIEDKQRDKLIDFVVGKFGEENVRRIITFGKLQTRQAIRDVSRVLGIDLAIADKLSKMVLIVFGKSKPIDYMIETNSEFKELIESSDELKRMGEIARKIAGLARGVSVHACGLVITPTPVTDYVPIQRDAHNEGLGITQYEFMQLEEVGLLKFDFLGLRNLNVIGTTLKKLKRDRNIDLDLIHLKPDDPNALQIIKKCETVGIFQMEGEGMKRTIRLIVPDSMEDICYIIAAYRPGPMALIPEYAEVKHGRKKAEYLIPELEPILGLTNGVITYQEQVIRIAVDLAGYSMGQADAFRKAMGKKLLDVMNKEKPVFIEGAIKNGFDKAKIEELWELLVKFANYGFNKAHSAMYATVTYWTAYLKAYYPLEFMASLLEGDLDNFDRITTDLEECARLGFEVLPPSINKSDYYFTVEDEKNIRFGLAAIKNIGKDIMKTIVSERKENGLYKSLDDLIQRNVKTKLGQKVIEYLIMSGALDEFGDRKALISIIPQILDKTKKIQQNAALGQIDLFAGNGKGENIVSFTDIPQDIKTSTHELLHWEKDLLGLYFSSHPLNNLKEFFASKNVVTITELKNKKGGEMVVLGALISNVKRISTKNKERMAFLSLEDKTGAVDAIVFPKTYDEVKDTFKPNIPMLIAGRVNIRDGQISIIYQKGMYIDENKFCTEFDGIIFKITKKHTQKQITQLKKFIKENPGETQVKVIVTEKGGNKTISLRNGIVSNDETKKYIELFPC